MNNPILIPMTVSSDQVTYEMSVGDSQQTFSMSCETSIEYIRGRLQEKEATPTEEVQSITPDEDYDALSLVTVDAIPSTYIGSDVPRQATLSANGNTVTASAGYYENNVSQSVQSGSATTPTGGITANPTISIDVNGKITAFVNKSESITPIVQEGYVTSGTAGTITFSGSATEQMTKRTSSDLSASGATVTAPSGYYPTDATKTISSGTEGTPTATKGTVSNHSVSVTPSVTNTVGYISGGTKTGTAVTVSASELVSGTKSISENGTGIDVTNYQKVNVAVPAPTPVLETQTKSYTPTESQQTETLTPSSGYDGIGEVDVTVGAIDSDYVGSGITRRSTLSVSGDTVTAQAGYYESGANASVASGSAGTPSATKGTVSNHSVSVTPSVTNTTGYITGGTKTGTAVTVSASDLVSGTLSITSSGTKDVTNYASASVASGSATASATKGVVSNHSITVTPSVTRTAGYVTAGTSSGTAITVSASELVSGSETKTQNGTFDVTNLAELVVNVSGGGGSNWTLIASGTLTVNTTSTSAGSAGTIECGSTAWTANDVIWVHIRGQSGKRNGYFYGSDAIFVNYRAKNGSTSSDASPAIQYIRVGSDGTYTCATGSYGVYAYSITTGGTLTVRRRYNSTNTLTINDKFDVDVYKLTLPTGKTLFT